MTPATGAWYPVALSSGIEPGTSNGTRLFGREIVVWRDSGGVAHVWDDRCPHRGMRLSLGFVRDNQIACLYHGWRYDAAGQCRHIPAHPQLTPPETIRVPVLASAERMGMIWVQSDDLPQGEPPPDREVTAVRSITVDCPSERALSHVSGPSLRPAGHAIDTDRTGGLDPPLVAFRYGDRILFSRRGAAALADQCVLHIVVPGDSRGPAQKRVSAWGEAVRRILELPMEPTDAVTLILYDFELDEGCYKVRFMLATLGLAHERVAIDVFPGGEHRTAAFLTLNPHGTVPVLADGDLVLTGAEAILTYLARRYDPMDHWLPADDPNLFGQVMAWLFFTADALRPAALARLNAIFEVEADAPAVIRAAKAAFRIMDDHMTARGFEGGDWFVGRPPTVADIALFPSIALSRDFGVEHDEYPALRRWRRRVRTYRTS